MIKAQIVADSLSPQGERLTSFLITFPRIILSEINTHRMLSKNTSSSRAIPFKKMVEAVQENPFIPIAWQKHHSGMQGTEYFTDKTDIEWLVNNHLAARDYAVERAKAASDKEATKQLCNRLLEPFMWTTMLITGSQEGWNNFFELRCPQYLQQGKTYKSKKEAIEIAHSKLSDKRGLPTTDLEWLQINKGQAEIHIMDLAEKIYDAMNESTPKQLKAGEWHIPFRDKIGVEILNIQRQGYKYSLDEIRVKISTAMAARTSYTVVGDEKEVNYERMIGLHDRLIAQNPPHSSPMEHCARAMDDSEYQTYIKGKLTELNPDRDFNENIEIEEPLHEEKGWCRNFKGFRSYRSILEDGE